MLISNAQPGQAQLQALEPADPQWMTDMYEQGWHKVAEGVLQRSEGEASPVESFFYNQDGLLWRVQQLQAQLTQFENLYSTSPSDDLAQIITDVEGEIAALNGRINSGQVEPFTGEEMANCTINYGANADAHWLTGSTPGVTGTANAYFNSNCGHYGKVYASVYVQGVLGTLTTTKTQTDDPPGSSSTSAYATFNAPGSTSCYSYAVSRVDSSALNILYTVEDNNFECPEVVTITVTGTPNYYTSYNGSGCATATWNATVGGASSYTINWYIGGVYQGSGATLSKQYCYTNQAVTATAIVTNSAGSSAQASYTTNIHYLEQPQDPCLAYGDCGGCGGYNEPFKPYQYQICREPIH